jgi:hypothetical protein
MAFATIYSFSNGGYTYDIQFDTASELIQVDTNNPGFYGPVNETILGFPEGHSFFSTCKNDGTLLKVVAIFDVPYAQVVYEANSPACVIVFTNCTLFINSIDTVDESFTGFNDGQVDINIVSDNATGIQYSLDATTYQSSNSFVGLSPGTYSVYVTTAEGCAVSGSFTIAAGGVQPETLVPEYPWQEGVCKWFRLIRAGVTYPVSEPIKWDNVNIVGKRDKDWHGYNYMFSDGIIELEFDCPAGKEVIEDEYNVNGSDGEVFFQYGFTYQGIDVVWFDGKLNLNTYKKYPGKVSASVEKKDFNAVFASRFDSKVSMAGETTLEGEIITPPTPIEFTLHAKEIVRNYKILNNVPDTVQETTFKKFVYVHPSTETPDVSEIEDHFGYPLNVSEQNPPVFDLFNWQMKFAGSYVFNIAFNFEIIMQAVIGLNVYRITNIFSKNGTETQIGTTLTGVLNTNATVSQTVIYATSQTVDLNIGDKIYFYTKIEFTENEIGSLARAVVVKPVQTGINISAQSLERSAATPTKAWWLFDTIDHTIRTITNKTARLKSSFLSLANATQLTDGQGSLFTTTNGKQIRRFEVEKYPLTIALKELLSSVKAIFCIGYGFEKKGNQEYVVVERVNYFYRNVEILTIDEVAAYREEAAKDLLYNEIEIGYNKFLEEGYNTLDEFNTRHEYVTPIKTNKLKLTAKSDLITSGYAIEDTRRKQFNETATNSSSYDDDGFLIAMRRDGPDVVPEKNEAFLTVDNLISPETSYNLRISPRRMLVNWGQWLASVFYYKPASEKIVNTYVAQNGELTTQFLSTEENFVGDTNKREWKENSNYLLSLLFSDVPEKIFAPEWIYVKCRLTPDRVNLINESLVGKRTSATNYGYIRVKDHEGNYQAGFAYETEYNYTTELFSCKLLKKYGPVTGGPCCDYLTVNGCYILVNGQKIIL